MATPLMTITLPVVGPAGTLGPEWANTLNAAFDTIDSHDHTTGKGKKIPTAGFSIDGDFNLNSFALLTANYVKLVNNVSTVSDYTTLYCINGDMYWKNASGVAIQLTSGSTINVAGVGGIGGDYTTSTASVTYSDITKTFLFKQNPTTTADIYSGSLFICETISAGNSVEIQAPSALASSYQLTLPTALPASKKIVTMTSSGVLSADDSFSSTLDIQNYTIVASVASSALTVAIKTLAGTDATTSNPAFISFRSDTAGSGVFVKRTITSALSVVVSSGATLGHSNATAQYIYVYALDNAGTVELAVSSTLFNDRVVQSTTAEGGAGGADTSSVLYSTTARTSKAIRLIARLTSNQTTAGTWAAVPTAITLMPENPDPVNIVVSSGSGAFSTTALNGSEVDVTNLTVTIQTSGKPVIIQMIPDSQSANSSYIGGNAPAAGTYFTRLLLDRGGSTIARFEIGFNHAGSDLYRIGSTVIFYDAPTAGTYTYKIKQSMSSAGTNAVTNYMRLIAYEL
jgi:hypothetical protein